MMQIETKCRSCGSPDLTSVLDLGYTPLANALLSEDELNYSEPTYPLELVLCRECSLVQITATVSPEVLFSEYLYFSSFSDTLLDHARMLAADLIGSHGLDSDDLVVEVASNDGYLLQYYKERGVQVLGIEPAGNVAAVARANHGIETLSEFFGPDLARRLAAEGKSAAVLHAHNVLAHVADLNGVVAGFEILLADDGVAVIEVPYVKDTIDQIEFDTIYHEHLCYFSATALKWLFERHGLVIEDIERIPIHGGSLRVYARRMSSKAREGERVKALLADEATWGVNHEGPYGEFAAGVQTLRGGVTGMLKDLKADGKTIAAYGAAAKGATLLNTFGIGSDLLDFVVDRSTYKQGLFMPGVHLPIYPPDRLLAERPDYVLLLTWNFADEIVSQQDEYRREGGRFIVPVPHPRVIA
jgi:SAM-dependent methyltransferase